MLFEGTNGRNRHRRDRGNDDLGDHIQSVIEHRIDDRQHAAAKMLYDPETEVKVPSGFICKVFFRILTVENGTRDDMRQIAEREGQYRAEAKRDSFVFDGVSEQTAKTQHRIGDDVVDEENGDGGKYTHITVGHEQCHNGGAADTRTQIHHDLNGRIGK